MEEVQEPQETFDISRLATTKNIVSMWQDGNFIVCFTDMGQKFRQAIPAGKILNKNKEGQWILEELNLRG